MPDVSIFDIKYYFIPTLGNYFKILFNLSNHDKVTFVLDLTFASADLFYLWALNDRNEAIEKSRNGIKWPFKRGKMLKISRGLLLST